MASICTRVNDSSLKVLVCVFVLCGWCLVGNGWEWCIVVVGGVWCRLK